MTKKQEAKFNQVMFSVVFVSFLVFIKVIMSLMG